MSTSPEGLFYGAPVLPYDVTGAAHQGAHGGRTMPTNLGAAYVGDDRVSIVCGHKVFDLAGRSYAQVVASDEVRRDVVFGRV